MADTKPHVNKQHSTAASKTFASGAAKEPATGRTEELSTDKFCSSKPTVHWVSDGWTCMSWEGADGQPGGYTVTNGQSAMFFDETGNMVFSTGVPGQSGCGGKLILNTGDQLHKANGTISIQATGPKDNETQAGSRGSGGNKSTKETPAYSVYAEGGVSIESQGDDCGIKGDNIIINALKTLTLKAGEVVNIEVGDGNGKFNLYAADVTIDAEFLNKNIDGHERTDGSGEVTVDQSTKAGATTSINTAGSIVHRVSGNYEIQADGRHNVRVGGNILFQSSGGGYSLKTVGKMYNTIFGCKEEKITGLPHPGVKDNPTETWKVSLGPNKLGWKLNSGNGFEFKFLTGNSSLTNSGGTLDIKAGGTMTVKALSIYLN